MTFYVLTYIPIGYVAQLSLNNLDSTRMSCASKSLTHVVKFDGSNLPLWRLGLDVALEEHDVQSITDGTCICPPEVILFIKSTLMDSVSIHSLLYIDTDSIIYIN